MKKLIVIALLFFTAPVFALSRTSGSPAEKGNIIVSLPLFSLGMGTGDLYKSGTFFSFGLINYLPAVEYFIMDSLAIGGQFGYERDKTDAQKITIFKMGPIADYYFDYKLGPTIPYAGAGIFYTNEKVGDAKSKTYELELHGGVIYMLGKYLSAYGQAQFNYDNAKNGESISGQKIQFIGGVKAFF